MTFTFEEAIDKHREMWNWIAENIEAEQWNINELKHIYMSENNYTDISLDCFCCHYAGTKRGNSNCSRCPIVWSDSSIQKGFMCEQEGSPYLEALECSEDGEYDKAARYAKLVAELPSREKRIDDL